MSASHVNYRENFFQHPALTVIHGDPNYSTLAKLEKECKANGKSVASTLGGGQQGHLGLVSSIAAYERVSPGVPFVRPILPVLPANIGAGTQFQITEAHHTFDSALAEFHACNLIERTILQQISTALDADCLANLIHEETGLLEGTVPVVLQELFDTYGAITPQSLTAAKASLEATVYNHAKPVVTVFTSINEYASMADAANASETDDQLVNIGLIIISRVTIFAGDVRKWHEKPRADQTWPNFKVHFKDAQKAIKRSQPAVTTDSLGFHGQANSANQQVLTANEAAQRESASNQLANQQAQQANTQMLEQMQLLMSTVLEAATTSNSQTRRNNGGGATRGNGRSNGRGRGNGRGRPELHPPAYCWTHGNCRHAGVDCRDRADGHIDTATYENTQGGSEERFHLL